MSQSASPTPDFGSIAAKATGYDEFRGPDGIRPHWQFLQPHVEDRAWIRLQDARISRLLEQSAVTYQVNGADRPWQLDGLPYVIDPLDWSRLERGLQQRARLLNAIVGDFYGSQTLLRGSLPPALAFANPNYLLPACGYHPPDNVFLNLIAFDLGRTPDGQWRVLSNRAEAPSGLGYALENRMIMSRSVPDLFGRGSIARLAHFFRDYSESLKSLAASSLVSDALTVILSAGPERTNDFEHTFLGRYLGFPVVEGADLTVRDERVYLKTLEGLKPVNLVIRQIESADSDPMELRVHSMLGAPGLLRAAASGHLLVANAIGSGVVENEAIMGFLPGLCEQILGESLELPSLASWWCGQTDALEFTIDNLDSLVIHSAFGRKTLLDTRVTTYLS
ncbi:MAG: circularly permuted type 2 ATP-grasp protein, partial [Pseudomonadales bacterium]|nr:circularly permuted type 2 ATP-grasp protein [Pseudomonadales bacterium]